MRRSSPGGSRPPASSWATPSRSSGCPRSDLFKPAEEGLEVRGAHDEPAAVAEGAQPSEADLLVRPPPGPAAAAGGDLVPGEEVALPVRWRGGWWARGPRYGRLPGRPRANCGFRAWGAARRFLGHGRLLLRAASSNTHR